MRIRSRYLLSRWVGSDRLGRVAWILGRRVAGRRVAGILLCRVRLHQERKRAKFIYGSTNGFVSQENVAVLTGGALGSAIFFCPAAALYTSLDSVAHFTPSPPEAGQAITFVLRMRSMTSTGPCDRYLLGPYSHAVSSVSIGQ